MSFKKSLFFLFLALIMGISTASAITIGEKNVSVSVGNDIVSKYYSRGVLYHGDGFITQPYVQFNVPFHEGFGPVSDISLTLGTWQSFQSDKKAAAHKGSNVRGWYETDVYSYLHFNLYEKVNIKTGWLMYHSPDGSFDQGQNLRIIATFGR